MLSAYTHVNTANDLPVWSGFRYLPQLNYEYKLKNNRLIDFEASANLYGNAGFQPFDTGSANGDLRPYRLWGRYSTNQLELRAGLQKINFGSASILRPLMWFDRIDPRDPLQITDVVWGVLARYYFLNNTNIWLWGLYGNNEAKGWEPFGTKKGTPEFGGRVQTPLKNGEVALTYHHRQANTAYMAGIPTGVNGADENRLGLDMKFDMAVGWWLEGSWSKYGQAIGDVSNQTILNAGLEYTFRVGNGLTLIYEQLAASMDRQPFAFANSTVFSLINCSYPFGTIDRLSAIVYYDWTNNRLYNFINWQRQYKKFTLFLMAYANPAANTLFTQVNGNNLYSGTGIQIMFVLNH